MIEKLNFEDYMNEYHDLWMIHRVMESIEDVDSEIENMFRYEYEKYLEE